jgi:DNA-directed RNA polymerase specialized sigma24 family protein
MLASITFGLRPLPPRTRLILTMKRPAGEERLPWWEREALTHLFETAFAQMSPPLRSETQRVIFLRYWEGRSIQDIAQYLGRHEQSVRSLLWRAIQRLRETLRQMGEDEP